MSAITYKVIFRGIEEEKISERSLTFIDVLSSELIPIPQKLISTLKKLSEISDDIISFQNISEVVVQGWEDNPPIFNYYLVVFVIDSANKIMEGFLIGNLKNKKSDFLIGIWPFNYNLEDVNSEKINERFDEILANHHKKSKICIVQS